MTTRSAASFSALGVLVTLAAVVALTAQAGTAARGSAGPTALLQGIDGGDVHGAVSFVSIPAQSGTSVAVLVHGLPAEAHVDVRLHTGRSLDRVSANFTQLTSGRATPGGTLRSYSPVRFRTGSNVRTPELTDGAHMVLVHADDTLVAYAHIPRAAR
jgi:hypothetical protein